MSIFLSYPFMHLPFPSVVAQQKIFRVFQLIRTLSRKPGKTVPQLARLLEITDRSVYRYLELLQEVGYFIDKDDHERHFLFEPENEKVKPTFEPEESDLIRELLTSAASQHPLKDSILKKLYLGSELIPLADNILKTHLAGMIAQLSKAIRTRKQVRLLHYHSPRSNSIVDRLVEPLGFTDNYAQYPVKEGLKQINGVTVATSTTTSRVVSS